MQTRTIQQTIEFDTSPRNIYALLMDSKKHESLAGERASISSKVGGKFSAWGGHITGFNLILKPGRKIVRASARRVAQELEPVGKIELSEDISAEKYRPFLKAKSACAMIAIALKTVRVG